MCNWDVRARKLTQYSTSVQPSMVIHWNTVSMANKKLSKLVMPPLGPCQPSLHSLPLMGHWRPCPEIAHGAGSSSAIASAERQTLCNHRKVFNNFTSDWIWCNRLFSWYLLLLLHQGCFLVTVFPFWQQDFNSRSCKWVFTSYLASSQYVKL